MTDNYCMKCGRGLQHKEVALHRKMVNRGAESFMCISCLAAYFKVNEQVLEEKIEQFKKNGCTLFLM